MFARRLDESFWAGPRTPQVRALLVISFEKEFVEVGDKEAEPAPNQQYDLDGQEPWLLRVLRSWQNKVSTKGTSWEIIMMNAMRFTLSNNVDGSGSGKCGWYRSSVGSVGAGVGSMFGCKGHSSSSELGSARIGHSSLGPSSC